MMGWLASDSLLAVGIQSLIANDEVLKALSGFCLM